MHKLELDGHCNQLPSLIRKIEKELPSLQFNAWRGRSASPMFESFIVVVNDVTEEQMTLIEKRLISARAAYVGTWGDKQIHNIVKYPDDWLQFFCSARNRRFYKEKVQTLAWT